MKKYLYVFITAIKEALMWRENLFVWVLIGILSYVMFPFLILSTYGDRTALEGYTKPMLITYYILIPIIEGITTSYVWSDIGKNIHEGIIGQYLTRPISYIFYTFSHEFGERVVRLLFSTLAVLIAVPFLKNYLLFPNISVTQLLFFASALALGIVVAGLTASAIGFISFWTTRSDWALHSWWVLSLFAAGYVAPTTFYPETFQTVLSYLPFSLLLESPIRVLLGTMTPNEILQKFVIGGVWIVFLVALNMLLWRRGVRRVDIVGL